MLIAAVSPKDGIIGWHESESSVKIPLMPQKRLHRKEQLCPFLCFITFLFAPFFLCLLSVYFCRDVVWRENNGREWITTYNTYSWQLRSSWVDPLVREARKVASVSRLSSQFSIFSSCFHQQEVCSFPSNYPTKSPLFLNLCLSLICSL